VASAGGEPRYLASTTFSSRPKMIIAIKGTTPRAASRRTAVRIDRRWTFCYERVTSAMVRHSTTPITT